MDDNMPNQSMPPNDQPVFGSGGGDVPQQSSQEPQLLGEMPAATQQTQQTPEQTQNVFLGQAQPEQTQSQPTNIQNVMSGNDSQSPNSGVATSQSIEQPQMVDVPQTTPNRGFKFPKKLLVILFIIILISLGGTLAIRYWPKNLLQFGKRGELTWWGLWEDESVVQPLIDEYQSENPNVTITYVQQSPQDYRERLTNALARGEGPDIFRFHNTWLPMLKSELDPIPAEIMSVEEFTNIYYPVMASDLTSGTKLMGIPLGYDAITLYINQDIFNAFGVQPPKTWDDFRNLSADLTIVNEEGRVTQWGSPFGRTENVDNWQEIVAMMLIQNGASFTDLTDTLSSDALSFYTLFAKEENAWDKTLPPSTVAFASGNVAMYFGPSWRAFEINQLNPMLNYKTVVVPQLPKVTSSDPDITIATYWVEGVWTRSANRDIAWDFMKFISSKESLEKMYTNASQTRAFGEAYPRVDMADMLTNHPVLGSIIGTAPYAKSWYLVSRTFDGPTGINSQISQYFEDAVNQGASKGMKKSTLTTLSSGVTQVLSQYGLVRAPQVSN